MTMEVLQVVTAPDWKGSNLVILTDELARPVAAEIAKNSMWLLPVVQFSPNKDWSCGDWLKQC